MENSSSNPAEPSGGTGCPAELTNICARRHWSLFWLFIAVALGTVIPRVLTVGNYSRDGSPFFSANDRSRWATIRALGDQGTYKIDDVIEDQETFNWDSIDKVRHVDDRGVMRSYSSKPTLLPTLVAGGYKLLKWVTGKTLKDDTTFAVRALLLAINVVPFGVFLWMFAHYINTIPIRDWSRYYMMLVAGLGTFLGVYTVSLNNHLPAAFSVMVALYCLFQIERGEGTGRHFVWAGLMSAFAAANELPALSFLALASIGCFWKSPAKFLTAFLPGSMLVVAGFFGTNFLAHGEWRPAYTHRSDGEVLDELNGDFGSQLDRGSLPEKLLAASELEIQAPEVVVDSWPGTPEDVRRWVVRDRLSNMQFAIRNRRGTDQYSVHGWSNWYDYPGSYWLTTNGRKSKVDQGQPSRLLYLFHILFGHHGIFSLTPIWILGFAGLPVLVFSNRLKIRWIGVAGILLTVVVVGFYVMRPEVDRNYGGVTSGLRWLFWLTPFWLTGMLPIVDWLGQTHRGRWVCYIALALSIASVSYSATNPWVHPWLYEIWEITGLPT